MHLFNQIIHKNRASYNKRLGYRFALYWVLSMLFLFHFYLVLDRLVEGHVTELFLTAVALRLFAALLSLFWVLQYRKSMESNQESAKRLDLQNQDPDDTYQNAFELMQENSPLYSKELLDRIYKKADQRAESQQLHPIPVLRQVEKLPLLFVLFGLLLSMGLQYKSLPSTWRAFYLNSLPKVTHKQYIELRPGNITVGRHETVVIQVANPEPNVEHRLFYRIEKEWREIALPDYRKSFENLDFSFDYYVKTPYAVSDTFRITVVDDPAVKTITIRYHYPSYTHLSPETDSTSSGQVKAPAGTKVSLYLQTNVPIQSGQMIFGSGSSLNIQRIDSQNFLSSFTVSRNDTYHFLLKDMLGRLSQPVSKSITVLPDLPPELKIVTPGQDTLLTQNMLLPLRFFASDDYGLRNLKLSYIINDGAVQTIELQDVISTRTMDKDYLFNLQSFNLLPGDVVTYWAEISDNGIQPQKAVTAKYRARFPSIEEIYKEIEKEESDKKDLMQSTLEKSKQMQQEFEQKRREMLKKNNPDWEDKRELQQFVEKQQDMNKQMDQVANDYQNLIDKFQNNQALSDETLQKMDKIKELMQEINNDQIQQAMKKMQEAMEKLDPDVLKKAMEDFKFSMEDFSQKIDQTLQLLESIKKEQNTQKALEIAQEMEKMQQALSDKTKEGKRTPEQLSKEQEEIREKLKNLQEQLDKLDKMLDPKKDKQMQQAMQDLQEMMKQDQLDQDMEMSQEALQENQKQQAMQAQQSAKQKMNKMSKKLGDMKNMMSAGGQSQATEALQRAIRELMFFSEQHESAAARYSNNPYLILNDEIAAFEGMNQSLRKLYSIPQVMLFMSPKFVYDANFTIDRFRAMFRDINDAVFFNLPKHQKDIQKGLNLMVYDLMQSMQNSQQGGGGGGSQSLMQMMQQMGEQQMAMNMITQQMLEQMQQQGGRMSSEMYQQMQRMAANEQQLADNIRRALQNNPDAQKQAGTMQNLADELESIAKQLKNNQIDRSLADRQDRILSRLLDAQKSIQKREFTNKRKAESADHPEWDTPESIRLRFDSLRKKALQEEDFRQFPRQYQEVIREYLKNLSEQGSN